MILDFLQSHGYSPKKVGPHQYESPCPLPGCGGTDRFVIWSEDNRAWCRRCLWNGDEIQLYRDVEGLEFKEAAEKAGQAEKVKNIVKKGKDPFVHPELGKPDKLFWYTDEDGKNQVMFVARFEHGPDGKKTFRQGKPDGLTWALKGVRLVLYNLPELKEARGVCFVEGEGKVKALQKLGIPATCNPMGSGKVVKQQEEFQILEPLRGKKVYIFPDNDEPGRKQADELCRLLQGIASVIKIIDLPGLMTGGDVIDYLKANESEGDEWCARSIVGHIKIAPAYAPPRNFFTLEELENLPVETSNHVPIFKRGYFNFGEGVIIAGSGGVGKSMLALEWGLHIAAGASWLDTLLVPKARRVHIMQWENSVRKVMLDRAKRMKRGMAERGIDVSGIGKMLSMSKRNYHYDLKLKGDQDKLMEDVRAVETEVVIYDCLSNLHTGNENDNSFMAGILDVLGNINVKLGTSCILVHHYNKPSQDPNQQQATHSGYRLRGATRIRDWARTLWLYVEEPNRKEVFRRLIMDKCNDGKVMSPVLLVRDDPTDPPDGVSKEDWVDPSSTFLCSVSNESKLCPPEAIQELVEKHDEDGIGIGNTALWDLVEEEIKCSKSSFQRSLKAAVKGKFLRWKKVGKNTFYSSTMRS